MRVYLAIEHFQEVAYQAFFPGFKKMFPFKIHIINSPIDPEDVVLMIRLFLAVLQMIQSSV